jgi:NAD(P)-dependent dehydrogenase (short-subunit alcohol dehydrogenase family)
MSDILKNKVVVVTGASSGIGRAIAIRAAEHGAKAVIVADIIEAPREGGRPTVEEIQAIGSAARFVRTDVSKRADNDALVEAAAEFGGVDVMVANAGITLRTDGADVPEDDYHRLLSINLDGPLFGAQAAARRSAPTASASTPWRPEPSTPSCFAPAPALPKPRRGSGSARRSGVSGSPPKSATPLPILARTSRATFRASRSSSTAACSPSCERHGRNG